MRTFRPMEDKKPAHGPLTAVDDKQMGLFL